MKIYDSDFSISSEVKMPKRAGGNRSLGIPTVEDRIAQQVVKSQLEPMVDHTFHPDSYGYRPGKSAHDALEAADKRCREFKWVVLDIDIKSFFDNLDHENCTCDTYSHPSTLNRTNTAYNHLRF